MLQLLILLLAAGPMSGGTAERVILRDPQSGPTPATNMMLIPQKVPDCRTDAQIQQALEEKANGELQSCDPPRSADQRRR